jgi:shikimate dehydrogenase
VSAAGSSSDGSADQAVGDGSSLGFVGVTTGSSSIRTVFPLWADALGLPTRTLRGYDIVPGSPAAEYRSVVAGIKADPSSRGALVTTHKMAVYAHARDLFDEFDDLAATFGEVSSISKPEGRLRGAAKDPITATLALDEFLAADHFGRTGSAALVLGSGGAGSALTHQLGLRSDRPSRVICTALDRQALDHHRELHERAAIPAGLMDYVLTRDAADVDRLLAELPPASLVVNATGMGKDIPGSPVSDAARFPERGVVWEFNYRGTLEFLHQARAQQEDRSLVVEDGWRYFIHGWTQVIAEVFAIDMPPETVARLRDIAAGVR